MQNYPACEEVSCIITYVSNAELSISLYFVLVPYLCFEHFKQFWKNKNKKLYTSQQDNGAQGPELQCLLKVKEDFS